MGCEAIGALACDSVLHQIAAGYLGTVSPFLIATRLWRSLSSRNARAIDLHQASQGRFHFDLDDWRQLKFFFYLTDVDLQPDPHVYVQGSHRCHALALLFTLFVGKSAGRMAISAAHGTIPGCRPFRCRGRPAPPAEPPPASERWMEILSAGDGMPERVHARPGPDPYGEPVPVLGRWLGGGERSGVLQAARRFWFAAMRPAWTLA